MDGKIKTIKMPVLKQGTNLNLMSYEFVPLSDVVDQIVKAQEEYINKKIQEELEIINNQSSLTIEDIYNMYHLYCDDEEQLSELYRESKVKNENSKDNVSSLKKRIKYCKNPMEKKKLQQELNALYKEQKRGKQGK